jgi:hypothetical protein
VRSLGLLRGGGMPGRGQFDLTFACGRAGAAFFGTKDVLKGLAKSTFGSDYRELTTIGAVFLANLPYCNCASSSLAPP